MIWKVDALVNNVWITNNVMLATQDEAMRYAANLESRWTAVKGTRTVRFTTPRLKPNFVFEAGKLMPIKLAKGNENEGK